MKWAFNLFASVIVGLVQANVGSGSDLIRELR
jgi:hypothetical protein